MISSTDFDDASTLVRRFMPPTLQQNWPLLSEALGTDVIVKHENHTPIGAFKVRGGLVYLDRLKRERPDVRGIVSATRGNHGQSLPFAARMVGLPCVILVPEGNSREKNAAMRALGAELIEYGRDFQEAADRSIEVAAERGYERVPSFHMDLVKGVGTYGIELFTAFPDLDVVYAPIGMGSGLCGLIAAKAALGAKADIIGVVADGAPAYALSFAAGQVVQTNTADTFADGMACRSPSDEALQMILAGATRVVRVTDAEIAEAMRLIYTTTHNLAEGAGAAAVAALTKEKTAMAGRKVGVILSGGNIDRELFLTVLGGGTPSSS
jgi:threonine dehydratase